MEGCAIGAIKRPAVNWSLCCYDKTTTSPELFSSSSFSQEFPNHLEIYVDGSKDGCSNTQHREKAVPQDRMCDSAMFEYIDTILRSSKASLTKNAAISLLTAIVNKNDDGQELSGQFCLILLMCR